MDVETTYPEVDENVFWQRDVRQVFIFSEKTGESMAGNLTAGRIIELSDGTRSVKEIGTALMKEFVSSPPEEEIMAFVCEFLSECEKRGFIQLRTTPREVSPVQEKGITTAEAEQLLDENAVVVIDEKASFDTTQEGNLMTYSVKKGTYLVFSEKERELLMAILEEKPLQEILSASGKEREGTRKILTEFVRELLDSGLARVRQ